MDADQLYDVVLNIYSDETDADNLKNIQVLLEHKASLIALPYTLTKKAIINRLINEARVLKIELASPVIDLIFQITVPAGMQHPCEDLQLQLSKKTNVVDRDKLRYIQALKHITSITIIPSLLKSAIKAPIGKRKNVIEETLRDINLFLSSSLEPANWPYDIWDQTYDALELVEHSQMYISDYSRAVIDNLYVHLEDLGH